MMTPAHIAASLIAWRNEAGWKRTAAVIFGAALPDLPMVGFYVYQKAIGTADRVIWSQSYFEFGWQLFFDAFNSIPLALLAMAVFVRTNQYLLWLVSASALLHMLCDFPVHHDDAHRHFLPLTNWKFESPVSYWDPRYHGRTFATLEFFFAICGSGYVAARGAHLPTRVAAGFNVAFYFFAIMLMAIVWLQLS